jgi:hypothetical protein
MRSNAYFVLYLMVVLEILIVIVDRDDAESVLKEANRELLAQLLRPPSIFNDSLVYKLPVKHFPDNQVLPSDRSQHVVFRVNRASDQDEVSISTSEIKGFCFKPMERRILADLAYDAAKDNLRNDDELQDKRQELVDNLVERLEWRPLPEDPTTVQLSFPFYVRRLGLYKLEFEVIVNHVEFLGKDSVRIANHRLALSQLPEEWRIRGKLDSLNHTRGVVYLIITPPGPITWPCY